MSYGNHLLQGFINNDIDAINRCASKMEYNEFIHYLRNEKLLLSFLHMKMSADENSLQAQDRYLLNAYNEIDEFILKTYNTLCSLPFTGKWSLAKGREYSAYYPAWFRREVRDMDVIFARKRDYQDFLRYLEGNGFAFKFIWLMKPQAIKVASALAYTGKQYDFGYKHSDKLWIEAHLHAFPISFYAALDFFDAKSRLSHDEFMIALILAEFANRDGTEKNYSIRDIMDFHFLLAKIHLVKNVSDDLISLIKNNALDISLLTFKDFITKGKISFPHIEAFDLLYEKCVDESQMSGLITAIATNNYKYEREHGLLYAVRNHQSVTEKEATISLGQHLEKEDLHQQYQRNSKEKLRLLNSGVPVNIDMHELTFFMED